MIAGLDASAVWLRGVARAVDGLVLGAVAVTAGSATSFGTAWLAGTSVGVYTYFVAFDLTGATLGKRLCGLRVRRNDEDRPPALHQAAARELFVAAGAIPLAGPGLALIAWITIAVGIRAHGVGWHDRIATTVVTQPNRLPRR